MGIVLYSCYEGVDCKTDTIFGASNSAGLIFAVWVFSRVYSLKPTKI